MISLFIAKSRFCSAEQWQAGDMRSEEPEGEIRNGSDKGKMNDKTVKLLASAGLLLVGINVMGKRICGDEESMDVIQTHASLAYRFTIAHGRPYSYIPEAGQINDMGRYQMRRPVGDFPVYQLLFPDLWAEVYDGQ